VKRVNHNPGIGPAGAAKDLDRGRERRAGGPGDKLEVDRQAEWRREIAELSKRVRGEAPVRRPDARQDVARAEVGPGLQGWQKVSRILPVGNPGQLDVQQSAKAAFVWRYRSGLACTSYRGSPGSRSGIVRRPTKS
jgi:hypothetical protein